MERWLEILFGGVGGSALLALMGWLFSRRRTANKASVIGESEGRDVLVTSPPYLKEPRRDDNLDELNPRHIGRALKNAAPFARRSIAETFTGVHVAWQLRVRQMLPYADGESIRLRLADEEDSFPFVVVDVPISQFPFLKFIHEESLMCVRGEIGQTTEYEIMLRNADLKLLEARLGD